MTDREKEMRGLRRGVLDWVTIGRALESIEESLRNIRATGIYEGSRVGCDLIQIRTRANEINRAARSLIHQIGEMK